MDIRRINISRFIWIGLITGIVLVAGCAHNHDPWDKYGPAQSERDVGLQQHTQLATRLVTGQSDR